MRRLKASPDKIPKFHRGVWILAIPAPCNPCNGRQPCNTYINYAGKALIVITAGAPASRRTREPMHPRADAPASRCIREPMHPRAGAPTSRSTREQCTREPVHPRPDALASRRICRAIHGQSGRAQGVLHGIEHQMRFGTRVGGGLMGGGSYRCGRDPAATSISGHGLHSDINGTPRDSIPSHAH